MSQSDTIWLVLGITLFIVALSFNVWLDFNIWKKQINNASNKRNHAAGAIIKTITSLPSVLMLASVSNFRWLWSLSTTGLMLLVWFNLCFDGFYNIARKEPFFWRGSEDFEDAEMDNFWQSIPQWLHITIKTILAFSTLYIYNIGLKR